MMDSYVEAGYPEEGPVFHGTWEETSGTWSVIRNELHLSFQSPTKKEIEATYLLYLHKGRSTLVPKEKKRDFFRTIRHHPESYDYSSDKAPFFRIGLLKNEDNQTVDTTAPNARLFLIDTSKSTNPDVVAMTEAAVVSP
ncbi:hypothetical protein VDG1235_4528 [Verrucomicrobiia bacterium DG1235]|nr:hypothetical protein VDG1235_4528 [Verrucomicrobiae bacterium DG1235]